MQKTYSEELRSGLVKKMMPPNHQSIQQISKESGISKVTLYNWKKPYQSKG